VTVQIYNRGKQTDTRNHNVKCVFITLHIMVSITMSISDDVRVV